MPQLRLCTHIKTNGQKCGSPALRHHTLCYFHYQWQRRDQRRVRLGGPVGMNKNSGVELPLLDGPEAILVSIMEIQHAMLDQRIPVKTATALLYSLQLALQAKISYFGLCHREPVRECPELDMELEMERAKAMRPAKEKCSRCPQQETCLSPRNCKKLPKLPAGIRRQGDHLVRDIPPLDIPESTTTSSSRADLDTAQEHDSSSRAEHAPACVVEGPAFSPPDPTPCHPERNTSTSDTTTPCHPERSAASSRGAEGPFVSSPEATAPETTSLPDSDTNLLRESSPAGNCGDQAPPQFPPSGAPHLPQLADVGSAHARRQTPTDASLLLATGNRHLATLYSDNILRFNSNSLIDLPGKFPQLIETNQPENQGGTSSGQS